MPELSSDEQAELEALFEEGEARGSFYRANYPSIKLTVGNSHSPWIVQLIRHGFPRQYLDCFAMEGLGGWAATECQPEEVNMVQEVWWVREIQRIYGCADIPISSGFEYIMRGTQLGSGLTEREQADLYVRDALHCLAYGYLSINIGQADTSDSYNPTIYGGSGFFRRNPLLTPKPSYVTWATMTQQLDGARYVRPLDTGSRSLYALEFQRTNAYVYPIWTVRGKRQLSVPVGAETVYLTDGMGNPTALVPSQGRVTLEATTSPMYLATASRIASSIIPGQATYEDDPLLLAIPPVIPAGERSATYRGCCLMIW